MSRIAARTIVTLAASTLLGCGEPPPPQPAPRRAEQPPPPRAEQPPPPRRTAPPPPRPRARPIPLVKPDAVSSACAPYDKKLAEGYASYLDAFSNAGLALTPDGRRLLYLSNRAGGSYQLYVGLVARPSAKPTPIAPAMDRIGGARLTPDGKTIVFVRDKGANENWQLFRASLDGKQVTPLTDRPGWYHRLPRISPDGQTLYYFRGAQRARETQLVAQPLAGGAARIVLKTQGFNFLSDVSPDGKRLLLTRLNSMSDSEQLVVEVATGQVKRLAPAQGTKAHAHSGVFSADGRGVYIITDQGVARAGLVRLDEQGAVQARYQPRTGEVAQVKVPPKGRLIAVLIDLGSHRRIELLDQKTLRRKRVVRHPLGAVSLGAFGDTGRRLVATISSPSAPMDAFAVDMRRGRVRPLRRDRRPGLARLARVKAREVRIPTFDKLQVPVITYLPRRLKRGRRLPVLVSVHGGPASASTIRWNPMAAYFISRGWAVVLPNVRGSTGYGKAYEKADNGRLRLDAVRDLEHVNKWLRGRPWADPRQLVVYGGSYGGYMTYMALGHQPELWRAGVGLVGVVNLRTFLKNTTGAIKLVFRDEFGRLEKDGPFLDRVSPIQVVAQFKAPLFVYQGHNDPRVPRSEQDQLVRALRRRNHPVEYMVAMDEGHSLSLRHNQLSFMGRVMRFLDVHLGHPGVPKGCAP
ncbi:MAG: S9 family peptidase [Candidatus Aminicenantes bacterium]|nr:S9 family peptidase [Candidatus Aminicenantes bacterium]